MLSSRVRRSLAAVGVAASLAVVVACGGGGAAGSGGGTSYPTGPAQPPATASADVTIVINGMNGSNSFSPNPGTVRSGQTVAWRNADSITHTATGNSFDTGNIAPGATSAPITFSATGGLDYHCRIHPSMVGTLSVTQ